MAKKRGDELTDEEIIRIARPKVTESAAATFTEVAFDTQLSVERGVIWMISFIEFQFSNLDLLTEVAADSQERIAAQITRESKTAVVAPGDPDLLQFSRPRCTRSAAIGTDAGPLWFFTNDVIVYNYPKPLPYASQSIYLGIVGSHSSDPHTVTARIGYTVRTVSDKFFFRVAQALLG